MSTGLQRLRYFVAVAEELSFTRAAARLYVSQPSLSSQVRALERDIGVELLRRTTRRVELTEAGRVLLDDARRILADLDTAVDRARRAAQVAAGTLRVAYTASVGYQALPLVLDELEVTAPHLTLSARRTWSTRVLEAVRSGDVDLGLVREFTPMRGLEGELVRLEPLAVFAGVRHPLAGRESVALDDLRGQRLVVVPRRFAPGFHDLVVGLCRRAGFDPPVVEISAPDNREPLLAHLSRHPDRVFVGPVSMSTTSWEGVVHVPIADDRARMGLSVVWASGGPGPGVTLAIAAAREVSRREGWLRQG